VYRLLAAAVVFLVGWPAMAQVITLECPRKPDVRDADTVVLERYQITLKPPSVYKSWKRIGGKYAHDWLGENLLVETMTPYKIRAFSQPWRATSFYTVPRIDYDIDRITLIINSGQRDSQKCALVKDVSTNKPKF
jgi:hypothetical protein